MTKRKKGALANLTLGSCADVLLKSEAVNHPSHYNEGKIEVIDYIEDQKLGFHLGNAVKYISRAGKKDPSKKAGGPQEGRLVYPAGDRPPDEGGGDMSSPFTFKDMADSCQHCHPVVGTNTGIRFFTACTHPENLQLGKTWGFCDGNVCPIVRAILDDGEEWE